MNSKIIVWDTEADGLLEDVTKLHCIVMQELGTDKFYEITGDNIREKFLKAIKDGYTYVAHNQIGYDFPVLESLHGISYYIQPDLIQEIPVQIIDTLVMSRELNPDRNLPKGCPTSVYNPNTGKHDKIGAHSLMAWAYRVGGHKPIIHDWKEQPFEVYVERCREDVKTTGLTLIELMKEAGIEL